MREWEEKAKIIREKNKIIEREYLIEKTNIEKSISSKIDSIKHKLFMESLKIKSFSEPLKSKKEIK